MDAKSERLLARRRDVYSQSGEDGVIEAILETLPASDRWCVEFGAWDGSHLSNTRHLIESRGYGAVLIEGSADRWKELAARYAGIDRVHAVNAFVGFAEGDGLDSILARTPVPADFDFLSIDIDGNDYHAWKATRRYQPKIVCIEFNPTVPIGHVFVQAADRSVSQGASLAALIELGREKGYHLICVVSANAFFARTDVFGPLGIGDNSEASLRTDLRSVTYLFQGFDGQLLLRGYRRMPWHALDFSEHDLQILPRRLRKYPENYTAGEAFLFQLFRLWRRLKRKTRRLASGAP